MKTRIRLILTLVITFLFAFTSSASARCEANGNKASSAPCKAEAPENQQAKRNYQLGHNELDAEYKAIELHDVFMMNGRKYHLLFVRPTDYAKGKVRNVYVYPDGFKSWRQNGLVVSLPEVTEFIVHNVPGNCGAVLLYGNRTIRIAWMARNMTRSSIPILTLTCVCPMDPRRKYWISFRTIPLTNTPGRVGRLEP